MEINEPNDTETTALSLPQGTVLGGSTCVGTDVDYFTFSANKPGTIAVTVRSTGTPLRVAVTGPAALAQAELGTGETRTITLPYNSTVNTTFFVRVEPAGTIGAEVGYSIEATYPYESGPRRRAV